MNQRIEQIKPSASVMLSNRAKELQKKDPSIIGLASGEPDFVTPERISAAAIRSLKEGNTHYVSPLGIPELRQAIQKKFLEENGINAPLEQILVTPGGKNAIYTVVQAVLDAGDEAMILDPSWVSYAPIVQAAGGVPVPVKLDYRENYQITAAALESAYSEKTRLLIINYPNNPTGRILHEEEANLLEVFLLAHPNVWLLSDEIYEKLIYDGRKHISLGARPPLRDRVITMNGFSKCAAMTGWRLGYLTCGEELFALVYRLFQHSISCVSGFLQYGALEAFRCKAEMEEMRRTYEERRNLFVSALNEIPGVSCVLPEGAFYAWVRFDVKGFDSTQMCEYLMEQAGVVGVPGSAYGEERVCFLRFSFATATRELETAVERIKKAVLALSGT